MATVPEVSSASLPQGRGPFSKVPLEIFLRITGHLCTSDLCAMRLTCTTAEQSLFHQFTAEFFNKRQFMLSTDSLQALLGIASCPRLSDRITHIIIGLDLYSVEGELQFTIDHSGPVTAVTRSNCLRRRTLDQEALLSSGAARDMLEEAFSKLPNLKTVELRDYNAITRRRNDDSQGEDKRIEWSSYGSTTARRECLDHPRFTDNRFEDAPTNWTSEIFATTLIAATRANLQLDSVDINTKRVNNAMNSDGFHFVPHLAPRVDTLLANLDRCFLHVRFNDHSVSVMTKSGLRNTRIWAFCNFLNKLRNIKHLRLNLSHIDVDQAADFMSWFAETSIPEYPLPDYFPPGTIRQMPPAFNVPLQKIDFGRFRTTSEALLSVINKFRDSLTGLSLQRLALNSDSGTVNNTNQPDINRWRKLFERLSNMPIKVTHWRIMSLMQYHPRYGTASVRFGSTGRINEDQLRVHQGPEWKSFLVGLGPLMDQHWPITRKSYHGDSDGHDTNYEDDTEEHGFLSNSGSDDDD